MKDFEAFQFENLDGELLELFETLIGWNDEVKTGIVEKQVVQRAGALHQRVGAPPRKTEARCIVSGPNCRAQYNRICDVILAQPLGRVTHPRWGSFRAVCEMVSGQENPGDEIDAIPFTLKFNETGLKSPPKPAPAAKAAVSARRGTQTATLTQGADPQTQRAGKEVEARANGYLLAMQSSSAGLGKLADTDASLARLAASVSALEAQNAGKDARREASLSLASALEARNRYLAGSPPIVTRKLEAGTSLSALCQQLYGGAANEKKAEILKLNRLPRPFWLAPGTEILLPDPRFKP